MWYRKDFVAETDFLLCFVFIFLCFIDLPLTYDIILISLPLSYIFFPVMRKCKIYSLSNISNISIFQIFNTILLTIVTTRYIAVPWLIHFITGSLYPLTFLLHFAHLPLPPLATTICSLYLWICLFVV